MPSQSHQQQDKQQDKIARAERLQTAIAALEARLAQLEPEGRVAPQGCCVARYQAFLVA